MPRKPRKTKSRVLETSTPVDNPESYKVVYYKSGRPAAKTPKRRSRKPVISEWIDIPKVPGWKVQFYTYDVTGLKYKMPKEPKGGWPRRDPRDSPQAGIVAQESTAKENL